MTVRFGFTTQVTPEKIAERIEPHNVNIIVTHEGYREYTENLVDLTEQITGVRDTSLALEVATELGTDLSDWLRYRLQRL